MKKTNPITELETQLNHRYERYSNKRLAIATYTVVVVSIGSSLGSFVIFENSYISILTFAVIAMIMINVALLMIVPPTGKLKASKELLLAAVRDPDRVKSIERRKVTLIDAKGRSVKLGPMEQQIWDEMVVPFIMKHGSESTPEKSGRRPTQSEQQHAEQKLKELTELEKNIQEESAQLKSESDKLKAEQADLAARAQDLKEAENLVIDRFSEVEQAQAELEQLQENLAVEAAAKQSSTTETPDSEAIAERDAQLKAKEAELKELTAKLVAEKEAMQAQKEDLERRQQEAAENFQVPSGAVLGDGERETFLKEKEAELESRMKELEMAASDLENRSRDIEDAENTLIDRLTELSEREAKIEQEEINKQIRQD